ncbi:MAG: hypothetical protein IJ747_08290, partial [Lachnospiraceae bacterium]|nr:hypothetical protein [Lachnospiraceae bacterium]
MPAYFCVRFICEKKNIYPNMVKDFYESLLAGGFSFLSGYWGSEEDSFEEIAAWNQKKLEANYEPESAEHYSRRYKQILFDYGGFSEVRMYMLNEREEEEFSFDLIVPEDELIEWNEGKPAYRPDRMEGLRRLAERIWQQPYIYMVQTELELSDPAPTGAEILAGAMPGVEPFAILPKHMWQTYCQSQKGTAVEGDISERFVERT